MKTVLAPIDFSRISHLVVDEAISIARAVDGRLVLLYVVPPAAALATEFARTEVGAKYYVLRAEKKAMAQLAVWQTRLRDEGVTAHAIHRIGLAGPQIVEEADRLEADYIVIGSHGHGAFYELLVGSTTTWVLKKAKCAVVIVPPKAKARSKRKVGGKRAQPVVTKRGVKTAAVMA